MAVLVALIPLIGLLIAVALRERPARARWAGSVAVAGIHLLVLAALLPQLPIETQLTTWSPTSLFHGRVILILDQAGWILVFAAVSLFGARLLRAAERGRMPSVVELALAFGYLSLAVAALLAGNLLTVALTWAGVDLLAYLFLLSQVEDESAVRQSTWSFVIGGASTLMIVAGAIPEAAGGGGPVTQTLEASVLAAAVWLRCGLWPLPRPQAGLDPSDSLLKDLSRQFPPAMALAALSHVLGGVADNSLAVVLLLLGGVNALYGGLQVHRRGIQTKETNEAGWSIAVGGVALLLMVGPREQLGTEFAWWGAVLMIGGAFHGWRKTMGPWGTWLRAVVGGLIVIGPGLVHGIWVADPASVGVSALHWLSAVMTLVVGALLSLVFFAGSSASPDQTETGEPFVEGAARAASLLATLALAGALAIAASIQLRPVLSVALVGPILALMGAIVLRKRNVERVRTYLERITDAFAWVSEEIRKMTISAGLIGTGALRTLGEVLEGRAALLWMLVVVLALALGMDAA